MVKNSKEKENVNNFQDARPVDISRMNAETLDMRKDMRICRQGVPNLQLKFLRISEGIIMYEI